MIPSHRRPTHPGEMLLEEFLKPSNLTQVEAAKRMSIPLNRLNEIVRGRRGVTADTAIRLAQLFETSAEFWMNLQSTWDIYEAAGRLHIDLREIEVVQPYAVAEGPTVRTSAWKESDFMRALRVATNEPAEVEAKEFDWCDPRLKEMVA